MLLAKTLVASFHATDLAVKLVSFEEYLSNV